MEEGMVKEDEEEEGGREGRKLDLFKATAWNPAGENQTESVLGRVVRDFGRLKSLT